MRNLFFYGSLRHVPLLEIVLGRGADALDVTAVVLPDHLVSCVAEGPFPTIAPSIGDAAKGLLVRGLSADDVARLDFYEGSFDYDLKQVRLSNGQKAEVYFPQAGRWTALEPWVLAEWETDWASLSCHAAREVMENANDPVVKLDVKLTVDAGQGKNWAEAH